jgi:hypothetical protein
MSAPEYGDTSRSWERVLARVLQLGLLGLFVYGLATRQLGMAMNGAVTLGVTLLPAVVRREYDYTMDAGLLLWITLAIVLHVAGSLGLYTRVPWYDGVTHALSASVVAGLGYATLRSFELHSAEIDVPPGFRGLFVVVFVLAFGAVWEAFEFGTVAVSGALGFDSPLIVFGIEDIVTDFVFNAVGAVAVALWGTSHFDGLVRFLRGRLSRHESE